jgi:hypothetical protein
MLKPHKENTPSEASTLQTFWLGYRDWMMERIHGPAPGSAAAAPGSPSAASLWWLALTIPAFILLAAVLVPLLAPGLVAGMTAAGSATVANASMTLGLGFGLAFLLGIPALLVRRLLRFVRHCCRRGRDIERGERRRAGP